MAYFDKYGVEFSDDRKTLIRCPKDFQGEYIIPNHVTLIDYGAFEQCKELTIVSIPNSVTEIGYATFKDCVVLSDVLIPDTVTIVGGEAFTGCTSLTSIIIPDSVTIIGLDAFCHCEKLETIKLSANIANIPGNDYDGICQTNAGCFAFCKSLKRIVIPPLVTKIESRTFWGCRSLNSITIPNSVTSVDKLAFDGCNNLTEIFVPLGQEERFCKMDGLKKYADIIRQTSERRRQREAEEQLLIEIQQRQEMLHGATLFFDTETTGILRGFNSQRPITDSYNWPRLVQLAWMMTDKEGKVLKQQSHIIIPEGFYILDDAVAVHHITTDRARKEGQLLRVVLDEFVSDLELAEQIVCHNVDFDKGVVGAELYRHDMDYDALKNKPATCTMKSSTDYCAIPKKNADGYKWPSLQELYCKLFGHEFSDAHDALADITATKECYFELKRRGIIKE